MMRTLTGIVAVVSLLLSGSAAQAAEAVLSFHATLQLTEGCPSNSEQCQGFLAWVDACQAQGYDSGFQAVRKGHATLMGQVTSFEQGCLDLPEPGQPALLRSYVQLTITARHDDTLKFFAAVMFDVAQGNTPATGTFSITGGTGRFAGALGSGTIGNVAVAGNPGAIIYQDGFLRLSGGNH